MMNDKFASDASGTGPVGRSDMILRDVAAASQELRDEVRQELLELPRRHFLHPATGLLILGLDWALFGGNVISLSLLAPFILMAGFILGGIGGSFCQRLLARDSLLKSMGKGFLCGVLVGMPFPVTGTVVAAWILSISGISAIRKRLGGRLQQVVKAEIRR